MVYWNLPKVAVGGMYMNNTVMDLSILNLAIAYVFVLVLLVIFKARGIRREKMILIATTRMTIQLTLMGFVLLYVCLLYTSHPTKITSVEKNAIRDCAYRAGAKKVYLEEEPKVAAVGAGLDIGKASGNMVLDIGGGTSDIAVLSLGDIVCSTSIKTAGNRITQDIIENVRSKRKMYIGEQTAEEIKQKIGNAMVVKDAETISVSGRDVETGLPHAIEINSNEVESYIRGSLQEIVHATKTILEVTPPELASDIVQHGLVLTGGGALLRNLDTLMRNELMIPVYVAENALHSVVDGCNIMLQNL